MARWHVDLPPEMDFLFDRLVERTSASSRVEVFRRALQLYDNMTTNEACEVILRRPDGSETRVVIS